jgi:SulP family sulfate permease
MLSGKSTNVVAAREPPPFMKNAVPLNRPARLLAAQDLLAGLSVAAVLIPQSLAYAQLAGMPAYRGLYTAAIAALVAAPLASSPYLQPGPTAISALLTYGALSPLASVGSAHYIELGLLLALLVGGIRVVIGLLHAGILAYAMSEPLLVGFVPGAAILIIASQFPVAIGAGTHGHNELFRAGWAIVHPENWRAGAIAIAALAAGILFISKRLHPLFPGVLLALIGAIVYSRLSGYSGATVGTAHVRLPPLTGSIPYDDLPSLILPALVIALVGFVEASSIARTYAALDRRRWDANRDFISQGVANLGAGMFGGFPVGASFSRSALNRLAGAQTNLSGLFTGLAVFAFLPFGFLLAPLPRPVLAAIVIVALMAVTQPLPLLRLARLSRPQFFVAGTTFLLTLALAPHVEYAVLVGIGLSIAVHLWRELSLEVPNWTDGEILHLRPQGILWFGTAARLEDTLLSLLERHSEVRQLCVHLDALGRIDTTGALALRSILQGAREAGVEIEIVDVRPRWTGLVHNVIEKEINPLRTEGSA